MAYRSYIRYNKLEQDKMQQSEKSPWQYKPDSGAAAPSGDHNETGSSTQRRVQVNMSWEAPEFIEQHHGLGWYVALIAVTAGLVALVYFIAKDIFAAIIIVIVSAIVWVFANQKPGVAKYEITPSGLSVNGKLYGFRNYKSFTIGQEGSLSSVNLFPLKRLMPPLSAYFDPKDEQKIMEALGNYLPYENRKLDTIDRLTRRLRL